MKSASIDSILLILSLILTRFTHRVFGADNAGSAKFNNLFAGGHGPHLISFDMDGGEIDISWDVSVPFFTIPLDHIGENGEVSPLLNVNTRGLSIAGILTAILTLAVPLFSRPGPGKHRRSDSRWSRMGNTFNEMVLGNNYVTPCIQRIVCTVVSEASHSDNPTSTDKIIDGLSSHRWFKEFTNGTVLQEAVRMGREGNRDCGRTYKECFVSSKILKSMMTQLGVI